MAKETTDIYNKDDVELKWPEESTLPTEATVTTISGFTVVLIILIGILLIILGGLLWWGRHLFIPATPEPTITAQRPTAEQNNEPESTNAEADVSVLEALSTSNEIGPIESDLAGTQLETLDADLATIDAIVAGSSE